MEKPRHEAPWKRKRRTDDVSTTDDGRVGGGARPGENACRVPSNGKNIRHVGETAGRQSVGPPCFSNVQCKLTVTFAGRETGVSLSKSLEMRTLGNLIGERVPHAFRRCRGQIRVEVTVVFGRHCAHQCVCGLRARRIVDTHTSTR